MEVMMLRWLMLQVPVGSVILFVLVFLYRILA